MKGVTAAQLKAAEDDWRKANPDKIPTAEQISEQAYQTFYNQAFADSGFGTGGSVQQAIQAVISRRRWRAVQRLIWRSKSTR